MTSLLRKGWRLPAASGLLLALSFPPLHLVAPPFLALTPLAVHLHGLPFGEDGPTRAWRAGLVTGGVAWALLLHWMLAMVPYTAMAIPGYLAVLVGLAAITGGVAWGAHGLARSGVHLWLAVPLAWTGGEWLRNHLPGPLAFPWLGLGTSLTSHPRWVGGASVVGERGLSFWLALEGGLLAVAWTSWRAGGSRGRRRAVVALTAAGVLAVAVPAWGFRLTAGVELRPLARVAVVQPDVSQETRLDPSLSDSVTLAVLGRLMPGLAETDPDLVILPEALFLVPLEGGAAESLVGRLREMAAQVGAPLVVGGLGGGEGAGGPSYNSVFVVDSGGLRDFRYDKHRLVPMVERLPLPDVPGLGSRRLGHGFGRGWPLARAGSVDVGALVCFEAAFQDVARGLSRAGADALVNVTNDAWLGWDDPPLRTGGLWQHPAHLVMRAVETRTGVVRAANTGRSMIVDPTGRVTATLPLFQEGVLVGPLWGAAGPTPFVRWGDVAGTGAFLVTLLLLAAQSILRRRVGTRPHNAPDG